MIVLVACTRLYTSLCPSVGRLVRWLVSHTFLFFYFYFWTSLLLPKWSSDFKYGPCPPARDFGSRVSGLVPLMTHFTLLYHKHKSITISNERIL